MLRAAAPVLRPVFLLLLMVLSASGLRAQGLPLKRDIEPFIWPGCLTEAPPAEPSAEDRMESRRLAGDATQAAILGDNVTASRLLGQALELDPTAPDIAYRLAVALENAARPTDAATAYCRYLALAPDAPDEGQVRERIPQLVASAGPFVTAAAAHAFTTGIAHYDAGNLVVAEAAFSQAAEADSAWSAPVYNRAVVRLAAGDSVAGLDDLRRYLMMSPYAADLDRVVAVIRARRPEPTAPYDAGRALASGLVVPGLGHFTTDRPVAGTVVLGSALGALALALTVERVRIECLAPIEDGRCPPGQTLEQDSERPYLVAGIAAAATVTVLGALDAYRSARSRNARATERRPIGVPLGGAAASLLAPAIGATAGGQVNVELVRLRF
jgi:tetratricopeptide (TPR) repeat protein